METTKRFKISLNIRVYNISAGFNLNDHPSGKDRPRLAQPFAKTHYSVPKMTLYLVFIPAI